jgi:hypothetical protein
MIASNLDVKNKVLEQVCTRTIRPCSVRVE